ncbi:MAG: hypothetical protein PF495_10110 [Spirochaetales bacterium]|jgi:hypothetical protein|nr:hypothetical protein [Spirochaetales bacterium]
MRKRIKRILIAVCFGALIGVIAVWIFLALAFKNFAVIDPFDRPVDEDDIQYIQNITAIKWPEETKYLSVSDNWIDGRFLAKFKWPVNIARSYAEEAQKPKISNVDLDRQFGEGEGNWILIPRLPGELKVWSLVYVDLKTGNGLVEISYPDKGGD